jgi:hypothetical protein
MEARYDDPEWSTNEYAFPAGGHLEGADEPAARCVVCFIVLLLNNLHLEGLDPQSVK